VLPLIEQNGVPVSGGDPVASTTLFDLHVGYNFGDKLAGTQVYLDMTNIFNRAPVFYNGSTGYDQYTGNIIGRITTLGFRLKL
jgi:outer membrane receptor protein involved in Fe transport